jgi:hypothetical protein
MVCKMVCNAAPSLPSFDHTQFLAHKQSWQPRYAKLLHCTLKLPLFRL